MAVAFDTSALGTDGGTTLSHTCTGSDLILIVAVADTQGDTLTATYNSVSMTRLINGSANSLSLFYLLNPSTGANTISVSGSTNGLRIASASYTGVSQVNFPNSYTVDTSAGSSKTVSTVSSISNSWLINASTCGASASPSITSNRTQRQTGSATFPPYSPGALFLGDSNGTVSNGANSTVFTMSGTGASNQSSAVISLSPVNSESTILNNINAYYKLDESSGNASDSIGGNTLTNNGTVTYGTGKINNGAINNATNTKYLAAASSISYSSGTNRTWNFWYNATAFTGYLLDNLNSAGGGLRMIAYGGGDSQIHMFANGNEVLSGTLSTSTWYMVTITKTGTTYELFINGTSKGTTAVGALSYTGDYFVGLNSGPTGGGGGNGTIDEIGVWSRVLTSGEISSLYNSGSGLAYPFSSTVSVNSGFFMFM